MDKPILVVIVNYFLADHIAALLGSGALSTQDVLLVDNASEPNRIEELAAHHSADVLLLDRNYGFAGAVNRAVASARPHDQILLLNPDVRLTASTVTKLRRTLAASDLTGLSPGVMNLDGSPQLVCGGPHTLWSFVIYFFFISRVLPRARGILYTPRQVAAVLQPEWLGMACVLLRGDAFERFGPIPEDEIVYGEDLVWGTTATRSGARFAVQNDLKVTHQKGAAGGSAGSWGAMGRAARRELGPLRGRLAAWTMWLGLRIRQLAGRKVVADRQSATLRTPAR